MVEGEDARNCRKICKCQVLIFSSKNLISLCFCAIMHVSKYRFFDLN